MEIVKRGNWKGWDYIIVRVPYNDVNSINLTTPSGINKEFGLRYMESEVGYTDNYDIREVLLWKRKSPLKKHEQFMPSAPYGEFPTIWALKNKKTPLSSNKSIQKMMKTKSGRAALAYH